MALWAARDCCCINILVRMRVSNCTRNGGLPIPPTKNGTYKTRSTQHEDTTHQQKLVPKNLVLLNFPEPSALLHPEGEGTHHKEKAPKYSCMAAAPVSYLHAKKEKVKLYVVVMMQEGTRMRYGEVSPQSRIKAKILI